MKPHLRPYESEDDYWRMRAFLREVFLLNGRRERAWPAYRLDYYRFHGLENLKQGSLEEHFFIWEEAGGRMAAFLNSEALGNAFLQMHPAFITPALELEMVETAEANLFREVEKGRRLAFWVNEHETGLQEILAGRGYTPGKLTEFQRRQGIPAQVQDIPLHPGYIVRALGDIDELPARSWASWTAFHPDKPDSDYDGWEWYLNVQRCPLYRRDLDIVAIAPDGSVASFTTVWFDDMTRSGAFEPVGTDKNHQRRGLGKAVMAEGLRRLQRLGADLAFVGSYEAPAHRLYESMGFTDCERSIPWVREW